MEILLSPQELQQARSRAPVPLKCQTCGSTYYRAKNEVLKQLKGANVTVSSFCKRSCWPDSAVQVECENCGKVFTKLQSHIRRSKHNFCGHSCSASFHNRHKTVGVRSSKLEKWLQSQLQTNHPTLKFLFNDKETLVGMELDIFMPSLRLAFELNGLFHYQPIFGAEKLSKIQKRDRNKTIACHAKQVDLCVIDVSGQSRFTEHSSQKYLSVIDKVIMGRLVELESTPKAPQA